MPPTVIATPGATDATSYITVAEADAYLDGRPNTAAWLAAPVPDRARAVIAATRLLDPLPWQGSRATASQSLSWPRAACPDADAPWGAGHDRRQAWVYYAPTVIPRRVTDAACELALQVLNAGGTDLGTLDADANLIAKSVGPLSKAWSPQGKPQGLGRFPSIVALLRPLLSPPGVVRS